MTNADIQNAALQDLINSKTRNVSDSVRRSNEADSKANSSGDSIGVEMIRGYAENGLIISARKAGKNGAAIVTVALDGEVIDCQTLNLTKPKYREAFVDAICEQNNSIDRNLLRRELIRKAAELATPPPTHDSEEGGRDDSETLLGKMSPSVREEARRTLESADLMQRIIDDVAAIGVAGEREVTATIYLAGTSRLLSKPLSVIVQGPTSSGKSYLIDMTAMLFPPETVLVATQQTPQALFYLPPGSLSHRFVVAGERSRIAKDDAAEATRALREMLSAGKLSKLIPVKESGRMQTKRVEQAGPIAFVESTSMATIFEEDANRCILLHTDERPQQTRRIVDRLAANYSGESSAGDVQRIIERHYALQRMLKAWPIVIPYARELAELFTSDRVEVRRAFPQLMSMIEASCLLHQMQRQFDRDGRLVATAEDYQLARHLLVGPLARLLGGRISEPARRFADRLAGRFAVDERFTSTEAAKGDSATQRAVTGWLKESCEAGVVEQIEPHKGSKPAIWKRTAATPDDVGDDCPELPALADVFPDGDFRHSDKEESDVP